MSSDNSSDVRVAFDLMEKIASCEIELGTQKYEEAHKDPRDYYLKLYQQCLYVVKFGKVE